MIVNPETVNLAFKGFKSIFSDAYLETPANADKIVMTVPSASRDETYGWLGAFPAMREWVGPRHVKNLVANAFVISNKKFESTVEISRDDIADDKLGLFKPVFSQMGQAARRHPEELIFGLLASGFATNCYDGQFFFDTDHPVTDATGAVTQVSNFQGGAGTAWYLLDTSQAIRPIIWQEREKYEFQQLTQDTSEYVFNLDRYLYGILTRVNAGFGLWQLAYGSKQTLNAANYAAARAAMMGFTADGGRRAQARGQSVRASGAADAGRGGPEPAEYRIWRGGRIEPVEGHCPIDRHPVSLKEPAMVALTAARNTPFRMGDIRVEPLAAGVKVFGGSLVMRNAAGYLTKGAAATGCVGVGRAEATVDNSAGAAGALSLEYRLGTFLFVNSAAGDLITIADIGKACFIVDDQTVAKTDATATRSRAGIVDAVEAIGVWVRCDEALTRAA